MSEDGYKIKMIHFTSNKKNEPFPLQFTKGSVLMLPDARTDCLSWLKMPTDLSQSTVPKKLFDSGYDVFIGCRRGTKYSRKHRDFNANFNHPSGTSFQYWDFNTQTVGEKDIPAFVSKIQKMNLNSGFETSKCKKLQIIPFGLSAAETLFTLQKFPQMSEAFISQVLPLAPCAVPTFQGFGFGEEVLDFSARRLLQDTLEEENGPRELSANIGSKWWDQVDSYCNNNTGACYSFCDWYPGNCNAFCNKSQFSAFCRPKRFTEFYELKQVALDKQIFSFYGAPVEWEMKVESLCGDERVSFETCEALKLTVSESFAEMSFQQLEHLWQQDFTKQFTEFSTTF